jgi:putative addiction module component (TIGR02574 family)
MSLSSDIMSHLFALPPGERFSLAQQLLDSIDIAEAERCDEQFGAELKRRREEMLRGENILPDWRAALSEIEQSFSK